MWLNLIPVRHARHIILTLKCRNIQNFIVVDFAGLVKMINAVGGVDLCIPQDVDDPYTSLQLIDGSWSG